MRSEYAANLALQANVKPVVLLADVAKEVDAIMALNLPFKERLAKVLALWHGE